MLHKTILIGLFFFFSKLYSQDSGIGVEYPSIVQTKIDSLKKVLNQVKNDTQAVNLLNQISKQYRAIDDYNSFLKAEEALEMAKELNYSKGIVQAYANLGFISNEQGLFDQAIDFYQKGADIAYKNKFHRDYIYCLNGIAIIHWERKDNQKALDMFKKNLTFQISIKAEREIAATYNNIGLINNEYKRYDTALVYLLQAKAIREKFGDEERNIATLNNIAIAFLGKNQPDTALYYSLRSLKLAKQFSQKRRIKESTFTLSEIYAKVGEFSQAYQYLKEHKIILDSIEKQDKASIIAEIKRKKDIQQQEEQIRILKQNQQLRNTIYVILTGFLVLLIIIVLRRAKKKQRSYSLIKQKNEEISNQKSIIEQQNAELLALNENLENLVEDRTKKLFEANLQLQNANRDLDTYVYRFAHDFRSPLSTMLGLTQLGKIEANKDSTKDIFDKIHFTIEQMDSLLRKLSTLYQVAHHIVEYEKFNLKITCESIINSQIKNFDMAVQDVKLNYIGLSEVHCDRHLLCIGLEHIFENTLLFYKQKPIKLDVEVYLQGSKALIVTIRDFGQGIAKEYLKKVFEMFFRANEQSKGNGMGLHIVQKVVEKLQGAVHIESEKNSYTQIDLIIPSYEEIRRQNQI